METMQNVILAEVEKVIKAAGLSAVENAEYANTGTVYAMDGLKSRLAVNYSFQSGYCSIIVTTAVPVTMPDNPPQYRVCAGGREVAWHHLDYIDGRRVEGFIETLKSIL